MPTVYLVSIIFSNNTLDYFSEHNAPYNKNKEIGWIKGFCMLLFLHLWCKVAFRSWKIKLCALLQTETKYYRKKKKKN